MQICTFYGTHVDVRRQPEVLALTFYLVQDSISHITLRFYVGSGGLYLRSLCLYPQTISPIPHIVKKSSLIRNET